VGSGLSPETRQALLVLARRSIATRLVGGRLLVKGEDYAEVAPQPRGAFVTLTDRNGELRGCIGHVLPHLPLDETVVSMAVAAALEDSRFDPVRAGEVPSLHIEISALTVPEPATSPEAVEVGRHGLIVSRGWAKGLLLPQVPSEWGWDREEFLRHTCMKAGLPPDAWRDPSTKIEWFEAEVWGEESEE
jgi:AmmeMemoRadiSam system protein A